VRQPWKGRIRQPRLGSDPALGRRSRAWRGRGIAPHLKRKILQWAALNGLEVVCTWTQACNSPMLRLNGQLGYVTTRNSIAASRTLPLNI
jgi:GNAT superfamily N-acetyltransferase